MSFVSLICGILTLVASWMIFKKMGHQGWEGIVPFYNTYVLCQELYGSGWKFLLLLIPLYNIYFIIKMQIDLAKAFNQGALRHRPAAAALHLPDDPGLRQRPVPRRCPGQHPA